MREEQGEVNEMWDSIPDQEKDILGKWKGPDEVCSVANIVSTLASWLQ